VLRAGAGFGAFTWFLERFRRGISIFFAARFGLLSVRLRHLCCLF
jgi:hypothetical protein